MSQMLFGRLGISLVYYLQGSGFDLQYWKVGEDEGMLGMQTQLNSNITFVQNSALLELWFLASIVCFLQMERSHHSYWIISDWPKIQSCLLYIDCERSISKVPTSKLKDGLPQCSHLLSAPSCMLTHASWVQCWLYLWVRWRSEPIKTGMER